MGSYGLKKYNHSCEEMLDSKKNNNQIDQAFIRTCPVGVKSCFGATGFYDHKDNDKTNDICKHSFLNCFVFSNFGRIFGLKKTLNLFRQKNNVK